MKETKADQAERLDKLLRVAGAARGMKLRVVYDPGDLGFRVIASLLSPSESYTIDEEIMIMQPHDSNARADLLWKVLQELQITLHENMAKAMSERDVRGRQYMLSKEDKRVLHDMFMDATMELHRDYHRYEENKKKNDAYQALLSRLFK